MTDFSTPYHSVVIVGCGLSGLYAARLLRKQFPDLLCVEATDRIGGRVQHVENFVGWPVQEGPEFVHGFTAPLRKLCEEMNIELREYQWPDRWWIDSEGRMLTAEDTDEEIDRMHELFANMFNQEYPSEDISAADWLKQQGATPKMLAAADACYANDWGCSLHQLGLRELITEARRTDASHARINGEPYVLLDRSLEEVIRFMAKDLLSTNKITLSWPVQKVEYGAGGAVVFGPEGSRIRCQHVLITAPITCLGRNDIEFVPPLPLRKQMAMKRIHMHNAVKVLLAFNRPFWPAGFFDAVCLDSFVREFWVTKYPPTTDDPELLNLHAMTGFTAGVPADIMSKLPEMEIVKRTLAQLDRMFGTEQTPKPASDAFVKAKVVDWSQRRYALGCYSSPSMGALVGDREALGAPVQHTIFFAGEATHPAVNPCMQFALQTGEHAAAQIIDAVYHLRLSRM